MVPARARGFAAGFEGGGGVLVAIGAKSLKVSPFTFSLLGFTPWFGSEEDLRISEEGGEGEEEGGGEGEEDVEVVEEDLSSELDCRVSG